MQTLKLQIGKTYRHTFTIPDGVKEITLSYEAKELEPGDVIENKVIDFREINKVLTRIKEVYQLEDLDVGSRRWRQVEARAIWTYYLIKIGRIRHADAAKIVGRKRSMMYHYVKLVEDLYETNIPFRERFNKIGIPWRS